MSVLTFLFTDIEGSTRRWEADAGAMRVAVETHNQVLREVVGANDGRVFNYTGDGMCAVFDSPPAAVDAAVAAQLALELPVRMGIATGEAELRGGDYFGTVLNRTARVMAAGHGGQILLDGATAALLTDVQLTEFGHRRLRDIAKPVELFQVGAPGLRTEFPPLKTLDSTPGNLKSASTSFVGREMLVAELEIAVKANRLVTLTGVGGVGKTRLALEVAARLRPDFSDGVWMIELAPLGDPAAVPEAVAAALGIIQQPGFSLSDSVAAALEGRSRLLIFDNCEHVLQAAADLIEAIIERSATVRILATGREGLRAADEKLWPVPSLSLENGIDSPAAALFVDRASDVAHGVAIVDSGDADAVVEICRRLDGIPLAIELAASRMVSMSPNELRDRLDDRFRLLVGSRRGLERHQTLRHTVQWSYDLLDATEQRLLNHCSVFAGGFDLATACGVVSSDDDLATLDVLDALVRKSLVVATRSSSRTRYSMLETIRQFAEEQLVQDGNADKARTAHARYFAQQESHVMALWDSERQREAYEWFALESANLRAAFRWAADHDNLDTSSAIAVYAAFLGAWVEQYEPVAWAEELIESAAARQHRRLAQLYAMAAQCYITSHSEQAIRYAELSRSAITSHRFDPVEREFEAWMWGVYAVIGQPERWVELCRSLIDQGSAPHSGTRACLSIAFTVAGDRDGARTAAQGLRVAADQTNNPRLACICLLAFGIAYLESDPEVARDVLVQGLKIAQDSGNATFKSHLALALARHAAGRHDTDDAFTYIALSIANYYDCGSFSLMANPLATLAFVFDQVGDYETAAKISGPADTPLTRALPELHTTIDHLSEVLGEDRYASLAQAGRAMTNAAMAQYALEQISATRARLSATREPR